MTKRISIISVIIVVIIIGLLMGRYFAHLLTTMFIGAIMALGLNFFFGYCGQINFGTAAFVAIGAYSSLLLQREFGFPFPIAAIAALLITAIVVLIISYPLLRLKGHGMAFGTLAIGLLVYYLLFAARGITGGENGLYAESWSIFGYEPGMLFYYFLSFGCMLMCFTICHLLINSRIGRAIKAIHDSEPAALAMGVNVQYYKTLALLINGLICSLGGIIYAQHVGWIAPANFGLSKSILIAVMIIVGGLGSNFGAVLGGMLLMLIPHFLVGLSQYYGMVYGLIMVVMLAFYPAGLVGLVSDFSRWSRRVVGILGRGQHSDA